MSGESRASAVETTNGRNQGAAGASAAVPIADLRGQRAFVRTLIGAGAAVAIAAADVSAAGWWGKKNEEPGTLALRITYSNKVDYEPLMVAVEKGFFKAEGLSVTPLVVTGGIESAEALATGSADVGAMGDAPAVISVCKVPANKIVCAYGGGSQRHRLIASNQIRTAKDLEGKKFGIQLGSSTQGCFLAWAKANGVALERVNILSLKPSEIPLAMASGQLDAMAGSEPWATNTEKQCGGKVHELANFRGCMGTSPMVIIASRRTMEQKPEAVVKLVRALTKAVASVNAHHAETAALCSSLTGLTVTDQERCTYTLAWKVRWTPEDAESLVLTGQFLLQHGKIAVLPDLGTAVETKYLKEAQ